MWFINFGFVILLVASASKAERQCVHFEGENGFAKIKQIPKFKENSTLSLEFMAKNCDGIALTIHNGEGYELEFDYFDFLTGENIRNFNLHGSCKGLWLKLTITIQPIKPLLEIGRAKIMGYYSDYEMNRFITSFEGKPLYFQFSSKKGWDDRSYSEPFEGYIRKVKVDDELQEVDQNGLSETVTFKECPKELQFGSNGGSVLLYNNFNVNDQFRAYFELKMKGNDLNCSGLILSAYSGDSHLIAEIENGYLILRLNNGDKHSIQRQISWYPVIHICDGNWHQVALLKNGQHTRLIVDNTSFEEDTISINFTAPLYLGKNPDIQKMSAVTSRENFNGYIRNLHVSKVVPEIGNDLTGDVQLCHCSD